MARQRFIWPSIWVSENFMELNYKERLLFIGIFSLADDEGRIKANTKSLKASIFPGDDIKLEEVESCIINLHNSGSILLYNSEVGRIACLPNWNDFQKPKYPKPSKLPPPPEIKKTSFNIPPTLGERSSNTSETLPYGMGRDGLGYIGMGLDGMDSTEKSSEFLSTLPLQETSNSEVVKSEKKSSYTSGLNCKEEVIEKSNRPKKQKK
jgi:hypothetical protein